jgi:hypothetical protein
MKILKELIAEILSEPQPKFDLEDVACSIFSRGLTTYVVLYQISIAKQFVDSYSKIDLTDFYAYGHQHSTMSAYRSVIAGVVYNKEFGSCNDAGVIEISVSHPDYKAGPLAYEIAMWQAGSLAPDRKTVSKSARKVWQKYSQRGDITSSPFDDVENPVTEDTVDDCRLHNPKDEISNRSEVNKSYRRNSGSKPARLDKMLDNAKIVKQIFSDHEINNMTLQNYLIRNLYELFDEYYQD